MTALTTPTACPDFDLFRHVLITGSTGSGKTASVIGPIIEKCLARHAADPNLKPALVIFDVKGDLTAPVRALAAQHGRAGDIIEMTPGSPDATNLFEDIGRDPYSGAVVLTSASWPDGGMIDHRGENHYWFQGAQNHVESALSWLRLFEQPCTATHLSTLLMGDNSRWRFQDGTTVAQSKAHQIVERLSSCADPELQRLSIRLEHLLEHRLRHDPRTRAIFQSVHAQIVGPLAHPLAQLIASDRPTWSPNSLLREGRILLVRLPSATEPRPANYVARVLKLALQRRILSRHAPDMKDVARECFFIIDEAQRVITTDSETGDQLFIDRCRSMKAGCIYATQSISALHGLFGENRLNEFLANVNTRLFGRTLDVPTTRVAADLLGEVDLIHGYRGVQIRFMPDPDPDVPPQPMFARGSGPGLISPVDLARLQPGEFFVSSGADRYLWHTRLDRAWRTPDIHTPMSPTSVPVWRQIHALAELEPVVAKPEQPWNQGPIVSATDDSLPAESSPDSPESAERETAKPRRPKWLPAA